MRFIIRADSSLSIGTGHVMRTSAIAEELIELGKNVVFIGNVSEISWLEDRVRSLGFSSIFDDEENFTSDPLTDILIIDSYSVSPLSSFINPEKWRAIVSIVDEITPNYFANLVIHPGILSNLKLKNGVTSLSGPKYIPLRKSLIEMNSCDKDLNTLNILVVGGGTDTNGFVSEIAKILMSLRTSFVACLFSDKIRLEKLDNRFKVLDIGPDLDIKVGGADLIFTTASTASLEFIARGIPMGVARAVTNQEHNYNNFGKLNIAAQIGQYELGKWDLDKNLITELVRNRDLREGLKNSSSNLVDYGGAKRIVAEILKLL